MLWWQVTPTAAASSAHTGALKHVLNLSAEIIAYAETPSQVALTSDEGRLPSGGEVLAL